MQEKKRISTMGPGTKSVWGGEDQLFYENAIAVPVVHSVTYGYESLEDWEAVALGQKAGHVYSRNTNPTVEVFEQKLRCLENAEDATSFSTGMAAISNTLFSLLKPNDRVVAIKDTYGGSNKIFIEFLPRNGVEVELCETTDFAAIEAEVERGCQVLYLETPTNPTLKVVDIERLSRVAHDAGATVIVDNTFATPINQNPLVLGADIVLHSATKFLGGHSDAMGGVICGKRELVRKVFHYREITGASLHPMSAYLLLRGMKTLSLRVERQNRNAMEIAEFLRSHPAIDEVFYPGLKDHPGHDIAARQMRGFGGVLSFSLRGGEDALRHLIANLRLAHKAASLGSVGTLAGPPRTTSHVELTAAERAAAGIPEGLVRYSVGIEDVEDLKQDLDDALKSSV